MKQMMILKYSLNIRFRKIYCANFHLQELPKIVPTPQECLLNY